MHVDHSDDILRRYLEDIRRTSPLTRQDEQSLFHLAAQGNRKAKQKLISANMRFVLKVAIQYRGCPVSLPDLVSEGAMGLVRAIDSFDSSRGLKFISYGVWWIKAYITRAINEQGNLIRLPANQHLRLRKALKEQAHGGEVGEDVQVLMHLAQSCISFDTPIKDDARFSYADILSDESLISADCLSEIDRTDSMLQRLVKRLPEREAKVISGIYGINQEAALALREVGDSLNISHDRVRQLRDQALRRIRRSGCHESLQEKFESYFEAKSL